MKFQRGEKTEYSLYVVFPKGAAIEDSQSNISGGRLLAHHGVPFYAQNGMH